MGQAPSGRIKCVVWDLDGTLWDGVLLEDAEVRPRAGAVELLRSLDEVGVLHSIASRNDPAAALDRLRELGIEDYFLCPQIGWGAKSHAVRRVAETLNLGLDALAFVDDQPFELAEVADALPEVRCVNAAELPDALRGPEFTPRFVTAESRGRRAMYRSQLLRDREQEEFPGTSEQFLAGLGMVLTVRRAEPGDLERAEELTVRTHQLNSTGRAYSYEELDAMRGSEDRVVLVASLEDRFGDYGVIGLALLDADPGMWRLRLLLTSCRVMSRGVGSVLLDHIVAAARDAGARLRADLVETGRNKVMRVAYAFAGFREVERHGDLVTLEADPDVVRPPGSAMRVDADWKPRRAEEART